MTSEPAKFVHDTKRIVRVNDAACALFRCEPCGLVDADMLDLLSDKNARGLRGLARLRLNLMQMHRSPLKHDKMDYDFVRCDGTVFCGHIASTQVLPDGLFETTVIYKYEVKRD